MTPTELRDVVRSGLLSFPVTPFDSDNRFDARAFAAHLDWLAAHPLAGMIVAGGTGEFFSLAPAEVPGIVAAAKAAGLGTPILAGCGYSTRIACDLAQDLQAAGADGILLLPHYLTEAPQQGLAAHVRQVCEATDLGVIVYNRGQCRLTADTLETLAAACPNLIGFKDGTGDIDTVRRITLRLGERLAYVGGMPTHELFAQAYRGAGVDTYSSAVFNFVPKIALQFHAAFTARDDATCATLLRRFYYPFAALRDRMPGYAVSAVKAGVALRGFGSGSVRPPLTALSTEETAMLAALVAAADA
jgi:5-dehydro-4-deoxyglucarate dehydratase